MQATAQFAAPWGRLLKLVTLLASVILVGVAIIGLRDAPTAGLMWQLSLVGLPLFILIVSVFFMIRGYELSGRQLLVRRLGWQSRIDLAGLLSVVADPAAMAKSIRTFGNGGLFVFAGKFRNKKLGSYRAYATDPRLAVVLTFANRKIVVTPHDPAAFVKQVSQNTTVSA